jgi:hypothetical protein
MGYSVKRLVSICTGMSGSASWEFSKPDYVLNCDRKDPLTKSTINARWLIHPAMVERQQIAVLLGVSSNGTALSRNELEIVASSIPNDPEPAKPTPPQITVPVNE